MTVQALKESSKPNSDAANRTDKFQDTMKHSEFDFIDHLLVKSREYKLFPILP